LAGEAPWVISAADRATTLEIVLRKQTLVISWHQFVYAEGDGEHVQIAFASHDVAINGAGLDLLLPAIASHRVVSLRESVRSERFSSQAVRFISEIVVQRVEG
jgi:hypothetical protein